MPTMNASRGSTSSSSSPTHSEALGSLRFLFVTGEEAGGVSRVSALSLPLSFGCGAAESLPEEGSTAEEGASCTSTESTSAETELEADGDEELTDADSTATASRARFFFHSCKRRKRSCFFCSAVKTGEEVAAAGSADEGVTEDLARLEEELPSSSSLWSFIRRAGLRPRFEEVDEDDEEEARLSFERFEEVEEDDELEDRLFFERSESTVSVAVRALFRD
mmetsp:Transcript_4437/g.13548  ORF Transcript_4437/g.13548 Transcript_4437/m.13548 type:complete len:221 (+) Transcript_4437:1691-2353(+)